MANIGPEAGGDLLKGLVIIAKEGIGRVLTILGDIVGQHAFNLPTSPVKDQKIRVGRMGGGGKGKCGEGACDGRGGFGCGGFEH